MFDKKKGALLAGVLLMAITAAGMEWENNGRIGSAAVWAQLETASQTDTTEDDALDSENAKKDWNLLDRLDVKSLTKESFSDFNAEEWKKAWKNSSTEDKTKSAEEDSLFAGMSLIEDGSSKQKKEAADSVDTKEQLQEGNRTSVLEASVQERAAAFVSQPAVEAQLQGQEAQPAAEAVPPQPAADTQPQQPSAPEVQPPEDAEAPDTPETAEVSAEPVNAYGGIALSESDYAALERIVQAEAGGEDSQGKILVAQVVLNRVLDENFADTAEEVILEKIGGSAQFAPTVDGRYYSVAVTQESKDAVYSAINGEDISEGALYFSARSKANPNDMRWFDRNLKWLFQYGGHEFYTLP